MQIFLGSILLKISQNYIDAVFNYHFIFTNLFNIQTKFVSN